MPTKYETELEAERAALRDRDVELLADELDTKRLLEQRGLAAEQRAKLEAHAGELADQRAAGARRIAKIGRALEEQAAQNAETQNDQEARQARYLEVGREAIAAAHRVGELKRELQELGVRCDLKPSTWAMNDAIKDAEWIGRAGKELEEATVCRLLRLPPPARPPSPPAEGLTLTPEELREQFPELYQRLVKDQQRNAAAKARSAVLADD